MVYFAFKGFSGGSQTYKMFVQDETIKWEVYAFEANPEFNQVLAEVTTEVEKRNYSMKMFVETAAWTQDGIIDFYLDTVNTRKHFWGSSIDENHPDVIQSKKKKVTVKCVDIANILRQYNENDLVIVKMDIEGAEYDLLLDFIKKDVYKLVDYLAIEFHRQVHRFKTPEDVFIEVLKLYGTNFVKWN